MDCMNLQAFGDSSDSQYSNSDTKSSDKANISIENSIKRKDVDQEAVSEDISAKL